MVRIGKAVKEASQRAALHLIPPVAERGILEAEAQMDAHDLVRAAIVLCTRGNRVDLGERLLAIANELRGESAPLPVGQRRKAHGGTSRARERRRLAKAGCAVLGTLEP